MPEVSSTVRIRGDIETVYQAAKDIEGLASFIDDVESITVLERREVPGGLETSSAWVGLLPEFKRKLRWTERDRWDDAAHTCVFELVEGDWDAYSGEWRFVSDGDEVEVRLVVRYEYNVPLVGPLIHRLVLKKVQDSTNRIQEGLRRRVEAGE